MDVDWDAVEAAGLLEGAEDLDDRRALVEFLTEAGLTLPEMVAAHERNALLRAAGDLRIRPGAGAFTLEQVAARLGADVEVVRRAWRSLGAVDPGADVPVASEDDVELLGIALRMVTAFGERNGWALLRRYASLLERATEATSSAVIGEIPDVSTIASGSEVATARVWDEVGAFVPVIGRFLDLALRHHVESVRRHFEDSGTPAGGRSTLLLGIGFADLSGYTSTSLSLDLEDLAGVVGEFEARAADVVARHGGRVVKFVGDAALFVSRDPEALVEMALALVQGDGGDERGLTARVGLTHGTVLARDGDYFGPPVNLAARLVDAADQQTVLVDDHLRAVLDPTRWALEELPPAELRGIPQPVVPYRLTRA